MDDARLQRRIQVVVVTTRAAATSMRPANGEVRAAIQRGILLLDGMTDEVAEATDGTREQWAQAKLELASLLEEPST
jgi:hypothetical protein